MYFFFFFCDLSTFYALPISHVPQWCRTPGKGDNRHFSQLRNHQDFRQNKCHLLLPFMIFLWFLFKARIPWNGLIPTKFHLGFEAVFVGQEQCKYNGGWGVFSCSSSGDFHITVIPLSLLLWRFKPPFGVSRATVKEGNF